IGFILLVLFLAIIVPQVIAADTAQADYLYAADISAYRFLPAVISAGDTVTLAIDVLNKGSIINLENIDLSLDTGNYFESVQTTNNINSIVGNTTKTTVLKFKVKDNTPAGYYQAILNLSYTRVDYQGVRTDVNQTKTLTIPVSTSQKNIGIEFNPKVISPGSQTELSVSVSNYSSMPISNVLFSWTEANKVILPLGSDNRRFAAYIGPGEKYDFNYLVVADPSIVTGIYPIDVSVNYTDSNGQRSQTSQVGLIVGGKTNFQVSSDTTSTGQISFSLANIGSNNAAAVVVQLTRQPGLTITGSDTVIIGNINKGDYSLANFTVQSTTLSDQNGAVQRTGTGFNRTANSQSATGTTQQTGGNFPNDFNGTNFPARQSQSGFVVDIYYTDTTGERQHIQQPFQLGTARTGITTTTGTGFGTAGRQQNSDQLLLVGVLAVILVVGLAYNKFVAKKKWKSLAKYTAIGIIIPLVIVFFAPSSLSSTILAAVFAIGALAVFFIKQTK
ncbi:MAG: hypothetical protein WC652_06755, partial [archaeon]